MRILVTGAGGFVGKVLAPELVAQGHEVIAATRNASSVPAGTPFEIKSVGPDTDWTDALKGVDAVVHLAARAHVLSETSTNPLAEHRRVNTEGTRRLAEQAAKQGVRRFVFLSSIGVLGNNSLRAKNGASFTEADDPNPHDDYSRSKWEAEQAIAQISGIEKVVIRPPLIYGPGVPGNLRRLLGLAKKGSLFPLGGIDNKRSLIGVHNLCSFITLAIQSPEAAGKTYVVADEEQVSTADLYISLCKGLGVRPRLINIPESILRGMLGAIGKGKMAERLCDTLVVDASKARQELGWKQPLTQQDGLQEMALSFMSDNRAGSKQ